MSTSRPQSTLQTLPTELILTVMRYLPDYRSLLSLLQSSRVFLATFDTAERQILKAILSQILHPKAVPEALNVRLQILSHRKSRRRASPEHNVCCQNESQFLNLSATPAAIAIPISAASGSTNAAPIGPPAQRWISVP